MNDESLFIQGLLYSGLLVGVLLLLGWWLYLSPLSRSTDETKPTSATVRIRLALMIGVGALLISVGGYWDASEHVATGIVPGGEDFLWPPHLMIYGGFLLAFVVAVSGLLALALPNWRAGIRDPRRWVRRDPLVGMTVLIAGYGLFSVPGDAIWHELFGIDLTAWSPPHIALVAASASLPLLSLGLLPRPKEGQSRLTGWRSLILLFYPVLALNEIYLIAVMEWELSLILGVVAARPIWLYPFLLGLFAFATLILTRKLIPGPWTATTAALLYFGWRLGATAFAEVVSGAPPRLTLVFLLGAIFIDIVAQRSTATGVRRALLLAGAFTVGYMLVAIPTLELLYATYLPAISVVDHLLGAVALALVGALLVGPMEQFGSWLIGESDGRRSVPLSLDPVAAGD